MNYHLQLSHDDDTAMMRRTRSEAIISQPLPSNNAHNSTTLLRTYTGPKTLTSTGSSDGSVFTDDSHSSPLATVLAMTTAKEKPKLPPKPKSATLKRRGFFLESDELDEAEV